VQAVVQYYENNEELRDGAPDETVRSQRMQDLMQQFRKILLKVTSHLLFSLSFLSIFQLLFPLILCINSNKIHTLTVKLFWSK
jgi:hypothetical protein